MRWLLPATILLLTCAAPAGAASCADAIRVDRQELRARGTPDRLLQGAGEVEAVIPACGEGEDTPIVATRLRGVPPTTAVEYHGKLYLAYGPPLPVDDDGSPWPYLGIPALALIAVAVIARRPRRP